MRHEQQVRALRRSKQQQPPQGHSLGEPGHHQRLRGGDGIVHSLLDDMVRHCHDDVLPGRTPACRTVSDHPPRQDRLVGQAALDAGA